MNTRSYSLGRFPAAPERGDIKKQEDKLSFGYDSELPGGYQDADFEMADLEEKAARIRQAKKRGLCAHGYRQGKPGATPSRDDDVETCLECGKVATRAELDADRKEITG